MLFAEKESNIIESFQMEKTDNIFLVSDSKDAAFAIGSIFDKGNWTHWVDTSGKDAPPPDFYCDDFQLMMDVMRVDDHGFKKKGKTINPTLTREHQLEKELKESGILDQSPNAKIFINAVTDLSTREDHNYNYYLANFKRTVENHKSKITRYRQNHPEHRIIFFVFDESSMYCEVEEANKAIKKGEMFIGYPHFWFFDKEFLSVFEKSDIDYLIWYTPYKHFEAIIPPLQIPSVCVYDCKKTLDNQKTYKPEYMMSTEE